MPPDGPGYDVTIAYHQVRSGLAAYYGGNSVSFTFRMYKICLWKNFRLTESQPGYIFLCQMMEEV